MLESQMNDELLDVADYKKLLISVLNQAIDDYIKLQHPSYRRKTYMQEAFLNAIDMFFDETYQLEAFVDEDSEHLSLNKLITEALGIESPDIKAFQEYIIKTTRDFWYANRAKTIYIPDTVSIEGHVFDIKQSDTTSIDFKNKAIFLNKEITTENEQNFLKTVLTVAYQITKTDISETDLQKQSNILFNLFKVNDTFRVPPKTLLRQVD